MIKPLPCSPRRLFQRLRGLPLQLLALTILPLVGLLVLVAFQSTFIHQQAMRSMVADHNEGAAYSVAAAIAANLRYRVVLLQTLADAGDRARLTTPGQVADIAAEFDGGVGLFNPGGDWLGPADKDAATWQQRPVAATVKSALAGHGPTFAVIPADAALGGQEGILLAVPAADSQAAAAGVFSIQSLGAAELTNRLQAGGHATIFILNSDGQILFQSGHGTLAEDRLIHPGVQAALRGETGRSYTSHPDGSEHVVAYSGISPAGWALIIEEPWVDVIDPRLRLSLLAPLALVPAVILAAVALWFGVRQIVRPIQKLEAAAAQLAWGNFSAIDEPVGGIEEIAELQGTLQRMAEQVRAYQESMRGYMAAMTRGQEDERRRLARELHDDTLQALIALDQRIQAAQRSLTAGTGAVPEKLAEVRELISEMIKSLRRFVQALRPTYLEDLGLIPALEMLVRDTRRDDLAVSFHLAGEARRLSPEQELTLYRLVQEALSNVARHSGASQAAVSLAFTETGISVEIADNGRGFAAPERVSDLASSGHFGLMGMQERAELIGAHLTIRSRPAQGTVVTVNCEHCQPVQI